MSTSNLLQGTTVADALDRVLRLPSVASKRFLTTKVDRSVGGLVAQQQCVGPLQVTMQACLGSPGQSIWCPKACQQSHSERRLSCSWHLTCIASDFASTFTSQLPLADVAVMAKSHQGLTGAATSIGEQPYKVHLPHQIGGTAQMPDVATAHLEAAVALHCG